MNVHRKEYYFNIYYLQVYILLWCIMLCCDMIVVFYSKVFFFKYSPSPAILCDLISSLWSYAVLNWLGKNQSNDYKLFCLISFLVSAAFGFSFYPIPTKSFINRVLNPLILPIIIYVRACVREREVYKHPFDFDIRCTCIDLM